MATRDYREELTAKLIERLEAGTAPWQKPWDARNVLPYNATTNKPYRGVNSLYLSMVADARGFEDPRWATYRQAQEAGWQVRKGAKGVGIEYWKHSNSTVLRNSDGEPIRDKDGKSLTQEVTLARPRVFYATVFNLREIEGAPPLETTRRGYQWDPLERAESILRSSRVPIIHDQADRAYYSPGRDEIHMPRRDQFRSAADHAGVALHELAHSTGHASRLNRDLTGAFGSPSYAKEELRAELASYFMSDQIGIPHDTERHASYVGNWIQALRSDKNEIFRAARDAERITEYVIGLDREQPMKAPTLSPIERRTFQNPERAAAQAAAAQAVEANPEEFLARFRAMPQSQAGRYISADLMKETFPEYAESRDSRAWLNAPLHNSAAVLASEQLRRVLAEPAQKGRDSVLLVTGIPGAGKTSMVINDSGFIADGMHAVYEGQLSNPKVALEKVGQVLDAGFHPVVMAVHAQPERALDNTLDRFDSLGRGASIALMANLQAGLPEGLRTVHERFGDRVTLEVVDRRNYDEPVLRKGWDQLRVLESEGSHEDIKHRLTTHLERRRAELSPDAYRQASGLEPERAGRQDRGVGPEERPPPGDRREAAPRGSETTSLKEQPPLAAAFEKLPRQTALDLHPELQTVYAQQDRFTAALADKFPTDEYSREAYIAAVRAEMIRKLDAGFVPAMPNARAQQQAEAPSDRSLPAGRVIDKKLDLER